MTDVEAAARARAAGVAVAPLTPCYASHPKRGALLLNYAGFSETTFPDAIKRLGEALR
jgi:DNA-binding transcriptional MocR family regulator